MVNLQYVQVMLGMKLDDKQIRNISSPYGELQWHIGLRVRMMQTGFFIVDNFHDPLGSLYNESKFDCYISGTQITH